MSVLSANLLPDADRMQIAAHKGGVVGLAGLNGQGLTQLLVRVFDHGKGTDVDGEVALVALLAARFRLCPGAMKMILDQSDSAKAITHTIGEQ